MFSSWLKFVSQGTLNSFFLLTQLVQRLWLHVCLCDLDTLLHYNKFSSYTRNMPSLWSDSYYTASFTYPLRSVSPPWHIYARTNNSYIWERRFLDINLSLAIGLICRNSRSLCSNLFCRQPIFFIISFVYIQQKFAMAFGYIFVCMEP